MTTADKCAEYSPPPHLPQVMKDKIALPNGFSSITANPLDGISSDAYIFVLFISKSIAQAFKYLYIFGWLSV